MSERGLNKILEKLSKAKKGLFIITCLDKNEIEVMGVMLNLDPEETLILLDSISDYVEKCKDDIELKYFGTGG